TSLPTTFVSASKVQATLAPNSPAYNAVKAGTFSVQVQNSSTSVSNSFAVQVPAAPNITSPSPASVPVSNNGGSTLLLSSRLLPLPKAWANFTTALTVTPTSATQVTFPLPSSLTSSPGSLLIFTENVFAAVAAGNGRNPSNAIVIQVVPATTITANPASLTFTYQKSGAVPGPQTLSLTSAGAAAFTASASTQNQINWLTVSP